MIKLSSAIDAMFEGTTNKKTNLKDGEYIDSLGMHKCKECHADKIFEFAPSFWVVCNL